MLLELESVVPLNLSIFSVLIILQNKVKIIKSEKMKVYLIWNIKHSEKTVFVIRTRRINRILVRGGDIIVRSGKTNFATLGSFLHPL